MKNERIKAFKTMVDSYKEIDKKLIDLKVAMHDLDKMSYADDIKFIEELEKQLDNVGIEFYKLKETIINRVKEI